jgi:hypothetical protein
MKSLTFFLVFTITLSYAQLQLPGWSADATVAQNIGNVNFKIHYGRPSVRERKIFGELVPYNRLWRTGAGKATTLSFDKDVKIGGKQLRAGVYSLATIPGEKEWTILFNSDTSKIYGDPSEYDAKTEVLQFKIKSNKAAKFTETFLIDLEQKRNDAVFALSWENTEVRFVIETGAHQEALAAIEREMQKNPEDQDTRLTAAWYYLMNNENAQKALQWSTEAMSREETWWAHEIKVEALVKLRKISEAKKAAAAAIDFLKKKKMEGWERGVAGFELKIKKLS